MEVGVDRLMNKDATTERKAEIPERLEGLAHSVCALEDNINTLKHRLGGALRIEINNPDVSNMEEPEQKTDIGSLIKGCEDRINVLSAIVGDLLNRLEL